MTTQIDWEPFEQYMERMFSKHHLVGCGVAVADGHRLLYAKGFGVRDLESNEPVSAQTTFGCASVTKSFTAMAIAQLEGRGLLSCDDSVIKHIPEFRLKGARDLSKVKIRHILSHTAGVPPIKRRVELDDLDSHVGYLASSDYQLLGEPGQYLSYCNDTFILNGLIIQRTSGQRYRDYVSEHILGAVGMTRSSYDIQTLLGLGNASTPYSYSGKTKSHTKHDWPVLGNYEVGGGVRTCALDLVKYGQVYLRDGNLGNGAQIVLPEQLRQMWDPPEYQVSEGVCYGHGLIITNTTRGFTLVGHSGGQAGTSAYFGFVPERNIVAAVLMNLTGAPSGAIWLAAINTALGLPVDAKQTDESSCCAAVEEPERFVGSYRSGEGAQLRIIMKDNSLMLKLTEDRMLPLSASDNRTLFFEAGGQKQALRFYFEDHPKTQDNKPWAVFLGLRMLRREETK